MWLISGTSSLTCVKFIYLEIYIYTHTHTSGVSLNILCLFLLGDEHLAQHVMILFSHCSGSVLYGN